MCDIPGVSHAGGFEQQDRHFVIGHRPVFDSTRHDEAVARAKVDGAVAELDAEGAFQAQEQLVDVFVQVPDELALELDELDLLPVQARDDLRTPVVGDRVEMAAEVDGVHRVAPPTSLQAAKPGRVRFQFLPGRWQKLKSDPT